MALARSMAVRDYILKCDRELPEGEQTTFKVRPLSAADQAKIDDNVASVQGAATEFTDKDKTIKMPLTTAAIAHRQLLKLTYGLVGWSNLNSAAGELVKFDGLTAEQRHDLLYQDWRDELCEFIDSLSYMTEAQLKN